MSIYSSKKKADKNIVDFDDVMHYAIDILSDDLVAAEYRDRFRYIFIDEFQDSNMLQETIIGRIAGKDNLFMVGDVKQSIYKFRLAEPEIFRAKYALYAQESEEESIKIDLSNNFRSKYAVTETVNTVFERIMDGYDGNARLKCTVDRAYPGIETECHIVVPQAQESESGSYDDAKPEEKMILKLIRESLGKEIYDVKQGVYRNVEYRDIVVLSRSRSGIKTLERFLNNEGVPAFGENTGGYFETVEVQVFTNLLRMIDNTSQDIPLISVMRCPVFDFSVEELAAVRIECRDGSFYEAVKGYTEGGADEALKEKLSRMLQQIAYWKELKNTITLEELVRILLYDTGYFDYCSGLPSGKQRISNLRLLVEKAGQFEQTSHSGLYGFISYIEAMKKNNLSIGEAKVIGENENVVRVMTVHKSKGLEFPVVILTGMGRSIRARGAGSGSIMHKDFAIGMPYVNRDEKWHRKTLLQRVIEAQKANEEFEEEIRILYVAMTRAMDQLLLTGTVKDPQKLDEVAGIGKSFIEMVYGPMSDAGEKIVIHERIEEDSSCDDSRVNSRARIADVFCMSREITDDRLRELIDERLSFEYPYRDISGVKSKYSVTELNRLRQEKLAEEAGENADDMSEAYAKAAAGEMPGERDERSTTLAQPAFSMERDSISSMQAGTLMHLVVEKLDFAEAAAHGRQYIRETIDRLCEDGTITDEEAAAVRIDNIEAFFRGEPGKRAAMSKHLYKEREFILRRNVKGADTIVQGIIDCYFEEEDGIVLIDYKNSYAGNEERERELVRMYEGQIDIYREALEIASGKPVKEAYLYLFGSKKFIAVK